MQSSRPSRLGVQLYIFDILCTLVALYLSAILRSLIPFGTGGALRPEITQVPWLVYAFAAICWPLALAYTRAYDPQRVLRWYDEALHVLLAGAAASISKAGSIWQISYLRRTIGAAQRFRGLPSYQGRAKLAADLARLALLSCTCGARFAWCPNHGARFNPHQADVAFFPCCPYHQFA